MRKNIDYDQTNKLFTKLNKLMKIKFDLKDCGCLNPDFSLDLPNICLVGPQGCGKSSLIESLIGFESLPINFENSKSVFTKRPIELKMVNVPNASFFEFKSDDSYKGKKFDISELKSKLSEIMSKEDKIRNEPIKVIVSSDRGFDLTIVDLPGYDEHNKITKEIIFNYAKHESNLLLFVKDANSDKFVEEMSTIKNNNIIKIIEEVDREFTRTVGVITKADLIFQVGHHSSSSSSNNETVNLIKKLLSKETTQEHPFSFILVKNRSDSNSKIEDNQYKEKEYFNTHMRSLTSTQFTVDSLADKLKNLIFTDSEVKKNLALLNKTLKEKMAEVQKSLLQYGTEYIQYTNDTKNTYVTSLVNTFSESLEKIFAGKMQESSDNLASHELKKIYNDFLLKKNKYTPGSVIKNEDIIKIIRLTEGDKLSGFPESEVIYSLLDDEIEHLRHEVKSYLDLINELSRETIKNQMQRIFCRFPRLNERVEELMNLFLEQNFEKLKHLIESLSEMNLSYLYIDEKSLSYNELLKKFVLNEESVAPTGRERSNTLASHHPQNSHLHHRPSLTTKDESNPDHYYNGLAEYVKILINHFYSLMVRNLREVIPKSTGYFFINSIKQNTRFYLLNEIQKDFATEDFLQEDPEVSKTRNFYLNLMKVLKASEKTLLYDEDLKTAIKGDNMKSIDKILENNYKNLNGYGDNPSIRRNSVDRSETKIQSEIKVNTEKEIKYNPNMNNNTLPKNSMQNILREEDSKKQTIPTNQPSSTNQNPSTSKEGMISFKMDPNSSDLKDVKVNVNMDAETAYRLYQDNKKYLPTTQQVISGVKTTASFAEKTANSMNKEDPGLVTGNKQQTKTKDPLTSLFGTGGSKSTQSSQPSKKGMF